MRHLTTLATLLLASWLTSASTAKAFTVKGASRALGNGEAYSWMRFDAQRRPRAIGITMTAQALENLPGDSHRVDHSLPLPRGWSIPPFQEVVLNWEPHGHIPAGVYDKPHFDFHFYLISAAQRSAITCIGEDLAICQKPPAAASFVPKDYIPAPGGEEAKMGSHWVDPTSGEFRGLPFTTTFIYGFYAGQMSFQEPMVTRAYLLTKPQVSIPIKLPQAVHKAGYYPTHYTIRYSSASDSYSLSLEGLRYQRKTR